MWVALNQRHKFICQKFPKVELKAKAVHQFTLLCTVSSYVISYDSKCMLDRVSRASCLKQTLSHILSNQLLEWLRPTIFLHPTIRQSHSTQHLARHWGVKVLRVLTCLSISLFSFLILGSIINVISFSKFTRFTTCINTSDVVGRHAVRISSFEAYWGLNCWTVSLLTWFSAWIHHLVIHTWFSM